MKKIDLSQMEKINASGSWWDCMKSDFAYLTNDIPGIIAVSLYPAPILGFMSVNCIRKTW